MKDRTLTFVQGLIKSDEELSHYGVLGMHWGKHLRGRGGSTRGNPRKFIKSKKSNVSEDHAIASELKKKRLHEMSNAELKRLNERMQLEMSYRNLTKSNVTYGQKFVQDVFEGAAKQLSTEYVKKGMTSGVGYAVKKAIHMR